MAKSPTNYNLNSKNTSKSIISINPSTGQELGRVAPISRSEIDAKMDKAREAFRTWSTLPIKERQKYLTRLNNAIIDQIDDIATLIAREQGKPIAEAKLAEVISVLAINKSLGRNAHRILRDVKAPHELILFTHKKSKYRHVPYGVVLIISPWNYPFSVPVPEIAAALVAGNTVVFKPPPASVLIGQKIDELFKQAVFPDGVLNTVFVTDNDAPYLVEHQEIDKVIFTGSTETGTKVMCTAAEQITPVLLELGGKDPAIVAADANVQRAAKGVVWGAMFSTGQVCASTERVYVEQPIADDFINTCVDEVKRLRVGDPTNENTDIGPLTTRHQLETVIDHIKDAVQKGAKIAVGGKRIGNRGFFFEPTVLTNVNHSMKVMTEETFGPILPIMVVDSIDKAITLANESQYGLSAYGWTNNRITAERLQRELEAGTVMINDSTCTWGEPAAPWGGFKKSGIGRTRAKFGLLEMVQVKYTSFDKGNNDFNPWWFPYDFSMHKFVDEAVQLLFAKKMIYKIRPLFRLLTNGRFVKTANWGHIFLNIKKLF